MAKKSLVLACPLSVATGAAKCIADMISCTFAINGTFDATYQLLASYDGGITFNALGSPTQDAAAVVTVPDAATHLAVQCTEWTSNTSVAAGVSGVVSA